MLPFFATLLFALIGIGALVVDGGLALTEQARLETATEMMVRELAYVSELPSEQAELAFSSGCLGIRSRADCVEEAYLAPILNPLGVDFSPGATGAERWQRVDRALDGAAIDPRGARLGGLDELVVGPGDVALSRSSPLLFGWAALSTRREGDTLPDLETIRAARTAEGVAPDLEGTDLRATGFRLESRAALAPRGSLAMRVGPPIPFQGGRTGGLVGVAWLVGDLDALSGVDTGAVEFDVTSQGLRRSDGGGVVACLFEVDGGVAHVGQSLAMVAGPGVSLPPEQWDSGYVPLVDAPACGASLGEIVGFLDLRVDARSSGVVRFEAPIAARRNASATPHTAAQATGARRVWNQAAGLESDVWRDHALRVARLGGVSPSSASRPLESGS